MVVVVVVDDDGDGDEEVVVDAIDIVYVVSLSVCLVCC